MHGYRFVAFALGLLVVLVGSAEAQKPILIGGSVALSGKLAKNGEYQQQAYQLYVEQLNTRGGLLGRQVALQLYDDRSDPATGVRLFEKLITEDKADLLVGPYSTPITAAVSTVTEKHKMVFMATGATADEIWQRGYRFVFQILNPISLEWDGTVEIAAQRGAKTIGFTGEDGDAFRIANPVGIAAAQKRGLKVVDLGYYPKATKDYSSIVLRAKSQGIEVFVCGCYEPDSIQIMRQAKELNYNPKMFVLSIGPTLPQFKEALGKDADWVVAPSNWEPLAHTPGNAEFVAAFTKKFGREPNYNAAAAYGAMQALETAVKKVGGLDPEKVRNALVQLDMHTVFGRYKVTETGAQVGKVLMVIQWQNGKKEIVWPDEIATAKLLYPTPAWSDRR